MNERLDALQAWLMKEFERLHEKLDHLNGRTRDLEETTAILHDRSARYERHLTDYWRAMAFGGGIGGGLLGVLEFLRHLWTGQR